MMEIVSMTETGLRIDSCVAYSRFSFVPNVEAIITNAKQLVNEATFYFELRPLTLKIPTLIFPKHISFTEDMFLADASYFEHITYNGEPLFLNVFSIEKLSSSYRVTPMFKDKPFLTTDVKTSCLELINQRRTR